MPTQCAGRHSKVPIQGPSRNGAVFSDETTVSNSLFQQISPKEELLSLQYRNRESKETRIRETKKENRRPKKNDLVEWLDGY